MNVAAPWKEDGKLSSMRKLTLKDPLYIAMDALPDVKEAAEAKLEKDTEEGLDDEAIAAFRRWLT